MTALTTMPPIAEQVFAAKSAKTRKVVHFITGVGGGGAENFMRLLVTQMRDTPWQSVVIAVRVHPHEVLAEQLRAAGCIVHDLNANALLKPSVWLAARRLIAAEKPDVVQTWMHHADFIGSTAALCAGVRNIVWGVRATEVFRNPGDSDLKMSLFHQALRWSSKLLPRRIIANSNAAIATHCDMGYPRSKFVWIPNGVDAQRFKPDAAKRSATRARLGIPPNAPVIGYVGRFHEIKDIPTLLKAAAILQQRCPEAHCILAGGNASDLDASERTALDALPAPSQIHFLPFSSTTSDYYPAFDVFTLCSRSEAFPNVVLEAMSTGLPCVTTDAGDCRTMLHDLGIIVPVRDAQGLAAGWESMLSLPASKREALALCSRERAMRNYSMDQAARSFMEVYDSLSA